MLPPASPRRRRCGRHRHHPHLIPDLNPDMETYRAPGGLFYPDASPCPGWVTDLGVGAGRTRARCPAGRRGRGGLVPCRPGPRRVGGRGRCLVRIPAAWPGSKADVPVPARPVVLHNRRTARRRARGSHRSRRAAADPAGGSTPCQACPLPVGSPVTTARLGPSCAHRPRHPPTAQTALAPVVQPG